jgi:L-lysine 6-transaminase
MQIEPQQVHATLGKSILVEGYPMVLDLDKSHGSWLYDARSQREFLDFFTFYASRAVAYNHPKLRDPDYLQRLLLAARLKPSNGDVYTTLFAEFVETFRQKALGPGMKYLFFVDGGALAVENALKAAFDWKTRKNMAAGRVTKDLKVVHFTHAFHGRSGYTLSLTNTSDPRKTQYFPKFDWPRIPSPGAEFPLDGERLERTVAGERKALQEIDNIYSRDGADNIAAIIVEPIQCEGGDRHLRPDFLQALRKMCDARETILIFDEVQTGMGGTGTMWAYESLDVRPDVVAFAKKAQTGGLMATDRFDEVDSVFKTKSRISSTFGGNLVDFVRCTRLLEIIEEDNLLENVHARGAQMLQRLEELQDRVEGVTNARGRGTLAAFDVPDTKSRDAVVAACSEMGLIVLGCGDRSVRLRPALDVSEEDVGWALDIVDKAAEQVLGVQEV